MLKDVIKKRMDKIMEVLMKNDIPCDTITATALQKISEQMSHSIPGRK